MLEIYTKEILYLRDRLYEIVAKHTGQPFEKIAQDSDRDFFMSAPQARDYGIVDKVIEHRAEVTKEKRKE